MPGIRSQQRAVQSPLVIVTPRCFKAALASPVGLGGRCEIKKVDDDIGSHSKSSSSDIEQTALQSWSVPNQRSSQSNPSSVISQKALQSSPLSSLVIKLSVRDVTVVITVDVEVGAGVVG